MSSVSRELKRIQYKTLNDKQSSLTIDETLYKALNIKHGDADKWLKDKAREVRQMLEQEAIDLNNKGLLKEKNKAYSDSTPEMRIQSYVCGKISNGVRQAANLEVIDKRFLSDA